MESAEIFLSGGGGASAEWLGYAASAGRPTPTSLQAIFGSRERVLRVVFAVSCVHESLKELVSDLGAKYFLYFPCFVALYRWSL